MQKETETINSNSSSKEARQPIGQVQAIFISPAKGEPMVSLDSITAVADDGLKGDRYSKEGFYSGKRIPDPDRGISIISSKGIEESNKILREEGFEPFAWEETRRNIIVDIDPSELNSLIDKQFRVGEVLVEGTDPCTPCVRPGELTGRDTKAQQAFVKAYLNTGGLRVRVLQGGQITKESKITT